MAMHLVNVIERRFGSMIEFGLDVGIDTEGRVWLIEVNPKPSHNALLEVKDVKTYRRSIQLPILYAKYVASQERESRRTFQTQTFH
jgi:D-alanine-D-alanine ligase-like ATP-grasp enzyme